MLKSRERRRCEKLDEGFLAVREICSAVSPTAGQNGRKTAPVHLTT